MLADSFDIAIDQLLSRTIDRAHVIFREKDVASSILEYITLRAGWLVYALELLASLIVLQTALLIVILYRT